MIAQCLYQSDPKNLASMGRQRLACQRAARKLQWGVQKERISETNEPVPLLMRPAVKEILQDAEQHRFDVLLIGNRDSLCCDAADMESFLTVLNSFNIHIFAGGQGSWVNGYRLSSPESAKHTGAAENCAGGNYFRSYWK